MLIYYGIVNFPRTYRRALIKKANRMKFYEKSFKARAVKLSNQRGSISIVAKELSVSNSTLGKWCREYENHGNNSFLAKAKNA